MDALNQDQKWAIVSLASAILAAVVVRGGIRAAWKVTQDEEPPLNPLRQDSDWTDALLFSLATGVTVGLARLAARAAATKWEEDRRLFPRR